MNPEKRSELNSHYSLQNGHRQRSVFHDAMRMPEARAMGLSRGDVSVWISRRNNMRRITDPGTGK